MPRKKIADQKSAVPVESAASSIAPSSKTRASRATATAVTHKHKKTTQVVETAPAPQSEAQPVAPLPAPSHHEIAALAYSYWESRGYQGDSSVEDWLRAEQELLHQRGLA